MKSGFNPNNIGDSLLFGYKDPNLYCKNVAYFVPREMKKCGYYGCITNLNYINENKRDFCHAHIPTVVFILSEYPTEINLEEWMFYYKLESRRGNYYILDIKTWVSTNIKPIEIKENTMTCEEYQDKLDSMSDEELSHEFCDRIGNENRECDEFSKEKKIDALLDHYSDNGCS